jgi:hypothetical protein
MSSLVIAGAVGIFIILGGTITASEVYAHPIRDFVRKTRRKEKYKMKPISLELFNLYPEK